MFIEDPMRTSYLEVYTDVGTGNSGNGSTAISNDSGSIPQVTGFNSFHEESAGLGPRWDLHTYMTG